MIAAACVVYYGDMYRVVLHDSRVLRLYLRLAYVCMAGVFSGIFYMAAWVKKDAPFSSSNCSLLTLFLSQIPLTEKVPVDDFNIYSPKVVQGTVICSLTAFLLFNIALWPVWGWVTLPMVSCIGFVPFF